MKTSRNRQSAAGRSTSPGVAIREDRQDAPRTGVAHSALAQEQSSGHAAEGHGTGVADAEGNAESYLVQSYAWFSFPCSYGPNTTTTYLFGVGPPGLEGPVRQPSSNPPRAGPEDRVMRPLSTPRVLLRLPWGRGQSVHW